MDFQLDVRPPTWDLVREQNAQPVLGKFERSR
jgi:hypothetical protein